MNKYLVKMLSSIVLTLGLTFSCTTMGGTTTSFSYDLNSVKVNQEIPKEYIKDVSSKGKIETISYSTYLYALDAANDGDMPSDSWHKIEKSANVYLPYNYDSSKDYNILYLLHGGGGNANEWFSTSLIEDIKLYDEPDFEKGAWFAGYWANTETSPLGDGDFVKILDNLISTGAIEPLIVVTPTMYYNSDDIELPPQTSDAWTEKFAMELQNDLIPAVETAYSTFAKSSKSKDLIASRDHRAIAGLSMGSITTWKSGLQRSLPYFSWIGNFSGGLTPEAGQVDEQVTTLWNKINSEDLKDYKINLLLSFNGTSDIAHDPHVLAYNKLIELSGDSERLVDGENAAFYDFDKYGHAWYAWFNFGYNSLLLFFK